MIGHGDAAGRDDACKLRGIRRGLAVGLAQDQPVDGSDADDAGRLGACRGVHHGASGLHAVSMRRRAAAGIDASRRWFCSGPA